MINIKKKWIIINIETKSREFKSKALLAKKLAESNYGVILINFRHLTDIKGLPKGIFLDRNIFKVRKRVLSEFKKRGFKLVCLDEEGLVYLNKEKYLKDRVPAETFELVDKFFCWGNEQKMIIEQKFGNQHPKLAVVGNPRIDLLRFKYSNLSNNYLVQLQSSFRPYILIVSNFTYVNMYNTPLDDEERYKYHLERHRKLKLVNNSEEESEFYNQYTHINTLLAYFLKLPSEIAKKFPNYTIIIRPHPSEDHRIWKKYTDEFPNIKVIYEGSLETWIRGADLVINNSCTSSIESLLLNRNCIAYRPITNEKYDQPLPNAVANNVTSEAEIFEIIKNIELTGESVNSNEVKKSFIKKLKEHILLDDEKESIDYIKNEIDKMKIKEEHFNKFIYRIKNGNYLFEMKLLISNILYYFDQFFTIKNEKLKNLVAFYKHYKWNKSYEDHKVEEINKEEILELYKEIDKANSSENSSDKLKIVKIKRNTFIISK